MCGRARSFHPVTPSPCHLIISMPKIIVRTRVNAPLEAVFDAARDIGLHCETARYTRERAVAGVTSGLIGLGQTVTFEAVHLGVRQRLTSRIVAFDAPHRFVDEMTRGAFQSLRHVHEFVANGAGATLMIDTLTWVSPLGVLGIVADHLVLKRHLKRFLRRRNRCFKCIVEARRNRKPS